MNPYLKRTLLVIAALLTNAIIHYLDWDDLTLKDWLTDPSYIVEAFLFPNIGTSATWAAYYLFPSFRKWVRETDQWIFAEAIPAIYDDAARRGVILSDDTLERLGDRMLYMCRRDWEFPEINLDPTEAAALA